MPHPLRFESKKGRICVAWVWNREGTEKLVNGKQHSVWLVPTGMKGLPQNVLLNFRLEFPKSDLTIYLPSGISEIFRQMVSTPRQVRTRRHSKGYCVKLRIGVWTNQSENFLPTANDRKAGFWTNQEKEREIWRWRSSFARYSSVAILNVTSPTFFFGICLTLLLTLLRTKI